MAEAVQEELGRRARIRWPNDVVWRGRKFCGILVEGDPRARGGYYVVGVGINTGRLPERLSKAISLQEAIGHPVDRAQLLRSVLRRIDGLYLLPHRRAHHDVERRWRELSWTLGKRVALLVGDERVRGKVTEMSIARGLTLELPDGATRTFRAEHVTLAE